jgi:hypothetical protein
MKNVQRLSTRAGDVQEKRDKVIFGPNSSLPEVKGH